MLNRFADGVARLSLVSAGLLVAAIALLVNVEVVCRYVFGTSTLVADEYAAYGFAVMVYLGMVHAVRHDALIRIDIPGRWSSFVARRGPRVFAALATLALNLVLLYALILTLAASLRFQSRSIQVSKTLLAWPQGLVVAAVGLLVLVSAVALVQAARKPR